MMDFLKDLKDFFCWLGEVIRECFGAVLAWIGLGFLNLARHFIEVEIVDENGRHTNL